MFTIGVTYSITEDWPIPTFVIKPIKEEKQEKSEMEALEGSDPTESVAHAVGVLLNILIDNNIPHNIMVADKGETVFVIPRKFDMLINAASFSTEWNDLCGIIKCKDENSFKTIDFT
jgi:hypothetical protein